MSEVWWIVPGRADDCDCISEKPIAAACEVEPVIPLRLYAELVEALTKIQCNEVHDPCIFAELTLGAIPPEVRAEIEKLEERP